MGLTSDIKAKVLGTWSPGCYHEGTITIHNAVRIVDGLNGMYHMRGPRGDNTFTGDEAYASFAGPITKAMQLDEYMYAVVCDNQQGVPHQKKMTQDERRSGQSSYAVRLAAEHPDYIKYPSECTFDDNGITRPSANPTTERFLMDEVMRNSTLRLRLMHYYCQRLTMDMVIPPHRILRFDYDFAGPWYFTADNKPYQCIASSTQLGEYDITANCIALKYKKHPIILQTADTDTIPLVTSLMFTHNSAQIAWIFATGGYVDCRRMVTDCLRVTGLSATMFILACILCGTDFYKKKWLSYWFNDDTIFSALRHPHCAAMFVGFDKQASGDWSAVINFVSWLHTARIKSKPHVGMKRKKANPNVDELDTFEGKKSKVHGAIITKWEPRGPPTVEYLQHISTPVSKELIASTLGKRYRLPSDEDIDTAQSRIQFNLWYWTRHWLDPKESFEQWRSTIVVFDAKSDAYKRQCDASFKSALWGYDELNALSIERAIASVGAGGEEEWDRQHPGINWDTAGCPIQAQTVV